MYKTGSSLLLFCVLLICSPFDLPAQKEIEKKIRAIQVVSVSPFTINSDDPNDTIAYFFRNDTTLIRRSYINSETLSIKAKNGEDSSLVSKRHRYFLYKHGAITGKWLENYQPTDRRFNENDTVEHVMNMFQKKFEIPLETLLKDSVTLVNSIEQGQTLQHTYTFNTHRHKNGADTMILEMSPQFSAIDFNFYGYPHRPNGKSLQRVSFVIQCDSAIRQNIPELALIRLQDYLSQVEEPAIREAEKYFNLRPMVHRP